MIPDGWQAIPFAKIADYKAGRTPARANPEYWQGADDGVPWVAISDMMEFGTVTETKEKISRAAFRDVFRGKTVPAGTLIMSFKLTIGRVATLGTDACHNEAIIAIHPRNGVDQRFLGYFLAQVDYDALQDRQVKGNTLNQEKIDRIEILLPPDDQPKQIADVLDLVRRAIQLQDDGLAIAQDLKRAAMRALFMKGLRGEAQKETEIGPVPESWVTLTVAEAVVPFRFDRRKQVAKSAYREVGEWPIIDQGQQAIAGYTDDLEKLITPDRPIIIFGDHTRAFKFVDYPFALGADGTKPLLAREGIDARYLFQALCALDVPSRGYNRHYTVLSKMCLPMPSTIGEQREIVAILDAIDRKIDLHRRKRAVLDELFKALLHKLMTGEIRVADLDLSALDAKPVAEVAA